MTTRDFVKNVFYHMPCIDIAAYTIEDAKLDIINFFRDCPDEMPDDLSPEKMRDIMTILIGYMNDQ